MRANAAATLALALGIALLVSARGAALSQTASPAPSATVPKISRDWLLDADSDTERFKRLQAYIRGYGQPMAEIGHRYLAVYQALDDRNYDLAAYHWDKIAIAMRNGTMVSPARKANSDAMFLDTVFKPVSDALKSNEAAKAWAGFAEGRQACLNCHDAEQVGYFNNQPMFYKTATPPPGLGVAKP
jgi:hypothetical protein